MNDYLSLAFAFQHSFSAFFYLYSRLLFEVTQFLSLILTKRVFNFLNFSQGTIAVVQISQMVKSLEVSQLDLN